MTRLRAAVSVLALVVAVLLGGCTQAPNTAAVVNGVVIQESSVNEMAEALVSSGAISTYAVARSSASAKLIAGEVARQVARQNGITLAPADISSLSTSNPTYATFLASSLGEEFAMDHTAAVQVTSEVSDWQAEFAAVNVDLNPRYGTWPAFLAELASTTAVTPPTGSMSVVSGS